MLQFEEQIVEISDVFANETSSASGCSCGCGSGAGAGAGA